MDLVRAFITNDNEAEAGKLLFQLHPELETPKIRVDAIT
jgi:hypothetical protein